jgi:phospholipid-translocating ATPase
MLLFAVIGAVVTFLWRLIFKPEVKKRDSGTAGLEFPRQIVAKDYIEKAPERRAEETDQATGAWELSHWKDIRVGDFVFLRNKDRIPADIIILSTSEPDSLCYVETKNLDGETNLKIKRGITEFSHIKSPADCLNIYGHIDSEPPSTNLYAYSGTFNLIPSLDADPKDRKHLPIGANGILLRGCVLRNTKYVIGVVAFTGPDTKIMLNSGETPSKRSRVDKQINPHILLNFSVLSCLCLVCACAGALYNGSFRMQLSSDMGVKPSDYDNDFISGVITFFNCLSIAGLT